MSRRRASAAILSLAGALAWACAPGCGSSPGRVVSPPRPVDPAGPRVVGADAGLEVQWWVVNRRPARVEFAPPQPDEPVNPDEPEPPDTLEPTPAEPPPLRATIVMGESVGDVLAPYLDRPVPMTDQERERWRLNGLRIVNVPIGDLAAVRARLSIAGPIHAQWLGEPPGWTVIAAGPRSRRGLVVAGDDGETDLGPGRLRLLARCWSVPLAADDARAGLRLELTPQHEETLDIDESLELEAGLRPTPTTLEAGRVFARLALGATVTEDTALVIVPAPPEERWGGAGEPPAAPPRPAQGPPVFKAPTLGEAMLTAGAGEGGAARAAVVLLLRAPRRFELIAGPAHGAVR